MCATGLLSDGLGSDHTELAALGALVALSAALVALNRAVHRCCILGPSDREPRLDDKLGRSVRHEPRLVIDDNGSHIPEYLETAVWRTGQAVTTMLLASKNAMVFGTRTGYLIEIDPCWSPSDTLAIDIGQTRQFTSSGQRWEHPCIRRQWFVDDGEILDADVYDDKYIVVTKWGVTLLSDSGREQLYELEDTFWSVGITKQGVALFGMSNNTVRVVNIRARMDGADLNSVEYDINLAKEETAVEEGSNPVYSIVVKNHFGVATSMNFAFWLDFEKASPYICRLISPHDVMNVAISDTGTILATALKYGDCQIWDTSNRTILQTFSKHLSTVYSLDLSSDGRYAVSGSGGYDSLTDFSVWVWETLSGAPIFHFTEHTRLVSALCIARNGSVITSASWDGTMRRVDLKYGDRWRFRAFLESGVQILPRDVLQHIFSFLI